MSYPHFVVKLPKLESNILKNSDIRTEHSIAEPLMTLGYNIEIPQVKNQLGIRNIQETLKNYPKIRRVNNPFETKLYETKDIDSKAKNYFELKNKPDVQSRAFYKFWELTYYFKDLIPIEKKNFKSLSLAEGPGGFVQAIILFREKFSRESKNDEYHAITIADVNGGSLLANVFRKFYRDRYYEFPTVPKKESDRSPDKSNGDLTKWKTLYLMRKKYYNSPEVLRNLEAFKVPGRSQQKRFDLITADGGFNWLDENNQEQEAYLLILGEICHALSFQAKSGHFVLKVFDLFTKVSVKFVNILQMFYNDVFITKPLTSRYTNSEKYIVCRNFKYDSENKEYWTNLIKVTKIFKNTIYQYQQNFYLVDIIPEIRMFDNVKKVITLINVTLSSLQIIEIQNFLIYVKSKNYYSGAYQDYLEKQKTANDFWINTFFTPRYENKKLLENIKLFSEKINQIAKEKY